MPMGEYKDFNDCLSQNRDKDNPEAYCGYIKNKIEGKNKRTKLTKLWREHKGKFKYSKKKKKLGKLWKEVTFAKVYVNNPNEAPKGTSLKRGKRGGIYYEDTKMPIKKSAGETAREKEETSIEGAKARKKTMKIFDNVMDKYNLRDVRKMDKYEKEFINEIKKNNIKLTEKDYYKLIDVNYHTAIRLLVKNKLLKKPSATLSKRTKLAKLWKEHKAKFSGLVQVPSDYLKKKDDKLYGYHNKRTINKIANFNSNGMKNYSMLDVCFLREGMYNTNGIEYKYDWETIHKFSTSYLGKPFYLNHSDTVGTEYGIVDSVYTDVIDGVNWLCAKIKVPEIPLTQDVLNRIENGLIKFISSTHRFIAYPTDHNKVKAMYGVGISAVSEPEVSGARIRDIVRNRNK